ncbi:MAG: helix-turn-helix domain-containing protein [Phaeodactylibacter sp.]|nr:helix-turn-helix domain-containing protein [Phaeodactylibacter sp.]
MAPNIAVILTDANRRILWVNEDFTSITGYTLSDALGKKPGSLLQGPGSEQDAIGRIRKGLDNMAPIKDEITNYRKNGEAYQCKLVIHPVFNQQQELINFIAFEIDGDKDDDVEIPLLQLNEKYSSSSLKGVEEVRLFMRLEALLRQDKLYLNPNLSLKTMADKLHTNTKYLSQVVNHHAGMNFQQFINTHRIREAKEKIVSEDYSNLTLFGIALQCGFKNKSTFYKVFKEATGLTPKEYLKQRQ